MGFSAVDDASDNMPSIVNFGVTLAVDYQGNLVKEGHQELSSPVISATKITTNLICIFLAKKILTEVTPSRFTLSQSGRISGL
jgi:hypothetical protein